MILLIFSFFEFKTGPLQNPITFNFVIKKSKNIPFLLGMDQSLFSLSLFWSHLEAPRDYVNKWKDKKFYYLSSMKVERSKTLDQPRNLGEGIQFNSGIVKMKPSLIFFPPFSIFDIKLEYWTYFTEISGWELVEKIDASKISNSTNENCPSCGGT